MKSKKKSKNIEDLRKVTPHKNRWPGDLGVSELPKIAPFVDIPAGRQFAKSMDKLGAKAIARNDLIVKAAKANAATQKKIAEAAKKKAAMKKKPLTYSEMKKAKKF